MAVPVHARSFAGGEITPEMFGRLDLDKFQTGLEICRNMIVQPHGPVSNRPGSQYILNQKDSSKKVNLLEFSFSTTQTYVLEFGDQYIRFHTNGGTLLEASQNITGVSQAAPGVLTYAGADPTNGQWFYLADIVGMTELNGRYVVVANVNTGANTFELQDLNGAAIDTSTFNAYVSGGTMSRVYEISSPYLEAELYDLHYVQDADVLTIVHPNHAPRELRRVGATNWTLTTISFTPTIAAPTGVSAVATTGSGSVTYDYVVTAIAANGLEESVASTNSSCTNNLATAGNKNTISWSTVADAIRYNVYKDKNGLYGYIGQTEDLSFVDDNIGADVTRTPPRSENPFSGTGNYPSAVSYFEQRRAFAATNNAPQKVWLTRSATESNLNYSIPTQDDDAITLTLKAREVNRIRHLLPLSELILLTTRGEWKVYAQNSDVLTPISAATRPQSFNGATNVQPVVTGNSAVYVRSESSRVHDIAYSWESQAFNSTDLSIMAPHLFDDYEIKDMTLTRSPTPVVWLVRDDGVLLGLTYMPSQKVWAWHRHDTDGLVESVAAVTENNRDVLYLSVQRTINGNTRRFIERMDFARPATLEDSYFVDAGLSYSGSPVTSVRGLWHLEGETVKVLADGAVHPDVVVTQGAITLQQAASKIHVGLGFVSDIKLLPLTLEAPAGGQGRVKNVNEVSIRVYRSSSIKAGPSLDTLREYKQRTSEPYGSPPAWVSDEVDITLTPSWSNGGQVYVRQDQPLPLTILSMTLEVAVGG